MHPKKYLFIYLQMVRVRTALLMALFAVVGGMAASPLHGLPPQIFLVILVIINLYVFATCMNDIADYEIDKINLRGKSAERPLVHGNGSKIELWRVGVGALVLAGILSLFVGRVPFLLFCSGAVSAYFYSMPPLRLSYRGILPPLMLPYVYVALPYLMAYYVVSDTLSSFAKILLLSLYLGFIGRIILKDFRDVAGDKKFGKRTFLIRFGQLATCLVAIMVWVWAWALLSWQNIGYPAFLACVSVLTVSIVTALMKLSLEKRLNQQLMYVAIVGRLGNGLVLECLLLLTQRNHPQMSTSFLMIGVLLLHLLMAYETYLYLDHPEQSKRPTLDLGRLIGAARIPRK